jgi:hypothetical protein
MGLIVDNEAQYNQYSLLYPGSIVLADQREIPTLTKHLKNTSKLHQVSFCSMESRAGFGCLNLNELPCRCFPCCNSIFESEGADGCLYKTITKPLRNQRAVITVKKEKSRVFNDERVGYDRNFGIP